MTDAVVRTVVREVYVVMSDMYPNSWLDRRGHDDDVLVAHATAAQYSRELRRPFRVHAVKITMELGPVIDPPAPAKRKVKRG